jgi:hypothetical protein
VQDCDYPSRLVCIVYLMRPSIDAIRFWQIWQIKNCNPVFLYCLPLKRFDGHCFNVHGFRVVKVTDRVC